jgi:ribulose-phosphate 3-epimerase
MASQTPSRQSQVPIVIAPSILAGDFGQFAREAQRVEQGGGDWLHCDIMDGHFVPNISFGPDVVASIHRSTKLPLDVHLMTERPDRFAEAFAKAGAARLTIHLEALGNKNLGTEGRAVFERRSDSSIEDTLLAIESHGCQRGLALNPLTPVSAVEPYLDKIDLILLMTVWPGFGGQRFMEEVVPKMRAARALVQQNGRPIYIEVDGGIDAATVGVCAEAGANAFVAGTSVFRHKTMDLAGAIRELREGAGG